MDAMILGSPFLSLSQMSSSASRKAIEKLFPEADAMDFAPSKTKSQRMMWGSPLYAGTIIS